MFPDTARALAAHHRLTPVLPSRQVLNWTALEIRRPAKPMGPAQRDILAYLTTHGASRADAIAESIGRTPGVVRTCVGHLVARGLARYVSPGLYAATGVEPSETDLRVAAMAGIGARQRAVLVYMRGEAPGTVMAYMELAIATRIEKRLLARVLRDLTDRGLIVRCAKGRYRLAQPDWFYAEL